MKDQKKITIAVISIALVITLAFGISAKGADLVLASVEYVDAKIAEVKALITSGNTGGSSGQTGTPVDQGRLNEMEKELSAALKEVEALRSRMNFLETVTREMSDTYGFQVLHLYKGDIIYALGTSELILRAGGAFVIGNEFNEGLSDITLGSNIDPGGSLVKDHFVLIPRGDGRGIKVTSDECYIMYRGSFSYVAADGN